MARLKGFVGPSYVSQSPLADQEELINWYYERMESTGASTDGALYPTPGFETISTSTQAPGKAHFFENSREFAVVGGQFVEYDINGVETVRGSVATDGNPATISSNGDGGGQLFITSGGNGYLFTLSTNTFATIAALAGIATMGDYLDGYFLNLDTGTSTLFISDLLDGATWDPTQFAQRSIGSDNWVSTKVANRFINLFGSQTSEVWYNTGASPFPFAPHPSGLLQFGCAAPFSPEVVEGAVYWLSATVSGHGAIMRIAGFNPESVTTNAVEYAIDTYGEVSDAVGDSYADLGHTFYLLTFPTANATWAYDLSTGPEYGWHRRGTWDSTGRAFDAQRALFHAFAFNEHRMLDTQSGQLLRMSSDIGTDVDGAELRRLRRSPCTIAENKRLYFSLFELFLEPGLGLQSGQGSDPQVMLRCSNDGGKTWGSELWRSAGAVGKYDTRVRWLRIGSGRKRVFEITVSDPVPYRLMGAWIEIGNAQQRQGRAA